MAENTVRIDSSTPVNITGTISAVPAGASVTPVTTLSAATTGTGTTVDFTRAQNDITMALLVTGTVTAGVVALDVSQDGTNWIMFSTANLASNTNAKLTATGEAWRYARGRVTTNITGGATVTCTLMSGG